MISIPVQSYESISLTTTCNEEADLGRQWETELWNTFHIWYSLRFEIKGRWYNIHKHLKHLSVKAWISRSKVHTDTSVLWFTASNAVYLKQLHTVFCCSQVLSPSVFSQALVTVLPHLLKNDIWELCLQWMWLCCTCTCRCQYDCSCGGVPQFFCCQINFYACQREKFNKFSMHICSSNVCLTCQTEILHPVMCGKIKGVSIWEKKTLLMLNCNIPADVCMNRFMLPLHLTVSIMHMSNCPQQHVCMA